MSVYLTMFHGRDSVDEELEDWGSQGPTIGPLDYVHLTYAIDVKFAQGKDEYTINFVNGLFPYGGKFYGDLSITSDATEAVAPTEGKL
jgi:hypothetical protein